MVELTSELRALVERAAAIEGVEPQAWLHAAIHEKAEESDQHARREASARPAPWQGWIFYPDEQRDTFRLYHGPRAAQLLYNSLRTDPARLATWPDVKLRAWSVAVGGLTLKDAADRSRTFMSAEAAIAALYASPEFSKAEG